jgi:hypothetical protein
MGNITATIKKRTVTNFGRMIVVDLLMGATYATNGDVLPSNAALGLDASLDAIILCGGGMAGYEFQVDHANRKIKAFTSNGAAPAALAEYTNGGAALVAATIRAVIFGDVPNA